MFDAKTSHCEHYSPVNGEAVYICSFTYTYYYYIMAFRCLSARRATELVEGFGYWMRQKNVDVVGRENILKIYVSYHAAYCVSGASFGRGGCKVCVCDYLLYNVFFGLQKIKSKTPIGLCCLNPISLMFLHFEYIFTVAKLLERNLIIGVDNNIMKNKNNHKKGEK